MTYQVEEPTQILTPDERRYSSYRRKDIYGICNICQCKKRLTFDHVPPAGCGNNTAVDVRPMLGAMTRGTREIENTIFQNGLKYRTICKECNQFMGSRYDPALIGFANSIASALNPGLTLPRYLTVNTRPSAIMRSVLGHLLAAKIETDSSLFDNEIRPCILDENVSVPDNYQLHYWIHPYETTVVMRDSMTIDPTKSPNGQFLFFQLLKFFPLGFWVLDRDHVISPPKFGNFNGIHPSDYRDITIDLHAVREADFPEAPEGMRATLVGETGSKAAMARRRPKRLRS